MKVFFPNHKPTVLFIQKPQQALSYYAPIQFIEFAAAAGVAKVLGEPELEDTDR